MKNYKFVQVQGPFKANQDIVQYIRNNINSDFRYIIQIGIQTKAQNLFNIDGQIFEMNQEEKLILNNMRIYSIYFLQDETESTLIDCVLN